MQLINPSIVVRKLVVTGHRKDYIVPFYTGLNIIYGDSDTGKSSILNLINYSLGSKSVDLYDEIESAGRYSFLEVDLSGHVHTIKRDLFDTKAFIEVFGCEIADIEKHFPRKYGPSYSKPGPNGIFSEYLLEVLGLPIIKVKESPSKLDSAFTSLSFRDLMKYMYLDQDAVGSKDLLSHNSGAYAVSVKNIQTFKYIFNLLDSQLAEIDQSISTNVNKKNKLSEKYQAVSSFLRDTDFATFDTIHNRLSALEQEKELITKEIHKIDKSAISDTSLHNDLRREIDLLEQSCQENIQQQNLVENNLDRYVRLKNEYLADINKIDLAINVQENIIIHDSVICPICNGILTRQSPETFQQSPIEKKKHEIQLLKERVKQLSALIDELRVKSESLKGNQNNLEKNLHIARRVFDKRTGKLLSPYLQQREALVGQRSALDEEISSLQYFLKVRNQLKQIDEEITRIQETIIQLQNQSSLLKEMMPSQDEVISAIGDELNIYLKAIPIKNRYGIAIDRKTYLPTVRDKIYYSLTSGGLRTIVSIGYFLSLLRYGLTKPSNLPAFLMIDTAGKYLRKTNDKEPRGTDLKADAEEGTTDPHKLENLYKYVFSLEADFDKNKRPCQIIIVDNDIPTRLNHKLRKYVRARYSTTGKDGNPIGFIDDASGYATST